MNDPVQIAADGAVSTIGIVPAVFGNWGTEHAPALANIIRDLAKDSAKVYDGRKVSSQRDQLAYKIEARGEGAFEAVLVADVREGVLLPGGIDGTVAVWKGGAFTGLVLLPVPTSLWKAVGREHSVARLEDPAGDIMGPCRLVTPDEAAWALAQI